MQEARLKALFEEQRIGIQQGLAEYAAEIDDALKETVAAAKELKTYREQILADLLAKSDGQLQDAEGRIYAAMQPKIAAQNEALADEIAAKMNCFWLFTVLLFLILLLIVLILI